MSDLAPDAVPLRDLPRDRPVALVLGHEEHGVSLAAQGACRRHIRIPGSGRVQSLNVAQTAAVLVVETLGPQAAGKVVYFMTIEGAKFRRPVVPGDQLRIHVTKVRHRGNVWKFAGVARVDGTSVAEATYAAMIMDSAPGAEPTA